MPITGSVDEIADEIRRFAELGVDRVELMLWPPTAESMTAIEPVIEQLKG